MTIRIKHYDTYKVISDREYDENIHEIYGEDKEEEIKQENKIIEKKKETKKKAKKQAIDINKDNVDDAIISPE